MNSEAMLLAVDGLEKSAMADDFDLLPEFGNPTLTTTPQDLDSVQSTAHSRLPARSSSHEPVPPEKEHLTYFMPRNLAARNQAHMDASNRTTNPRTPQARHSVRTPKTYLAYSKPSSDEELRKTSIKRFPSYFASSSADSLDPISQSGARPDTPKLETDASNTTGDYNCTFCGSKSNRFIGRAELFAHFQSVHGLGPDRHKQADSRHVINSQRNNRENKVGIAAASSKSPVRTEPVDLEKFCLASMEEPATVERHSPKPSSSRTTTPSSEPNHPEPSKPTEGNEPYLILCSLFLEFLAANLILGFLFHLASPSLQTQSIIELLRLTHVFLHTSLIWHAITYPRTTWKGLSAHSSLSTFSQGSAAQKVIRHMLTLCTTGLLSKKICFALGDPHPQLHEVRTACITLSMLLHALWPAIQSTIKALLSNSPKESTQAPRPQQMPLAEDPADLSAPIPPPSISPSTSNP